MYMTTSLHPSAGLALPVLVVRAVYWSTPLFMALDYAYGVSLRVPFPDTMPAAKMAYYLVDVACGIAMAFRPRWTAAVGLAESTANIVLLIVSTWAAYLGMLESAASPDVVVSNPFTPEAVASLVLSALVLAASYVFNKGPR